MAKPEANTFFRDLQSKRDLEANRAMERFNSPLSPDDIQRVINRQSDKELEDHIQTVARKLVDLHESGRPGDVQIRSAQKVHDAHLEVLVSHSDIFSKQADPFRGNMDIVMDQYIQSDSVKKLVEFCYTGEIKVDYLSVLGVLKTAEKLQINIAIRLCRAFLARLLTPGNIIYTLEAAEQNNLVDLYDLSLHKLINSFYAVVSHKQFLKWDVGKVCFFLGHPDLKINSEFDVFKACFRWLDASRSQRMKHIIDIVSKVRLANMTAEELVQCAKYDPITNDNAAVREMISDANWAITLSEKERIWSRYTFLPRRMAPATGTVGMMDLTK